MQGNENELNTKIDSLTNRRVCVCVRDFFLTVCRLPRLQSKRRGLWVHGRKKTHLVISNTANLIINKLIIFSLFVSCLGKRCINHFHCRARYVNIFPPPSLTKPSLLTPWVPNFHFRCGTQNVRFFFLAANHERSGRKPLPHSLPDNFVLSKILYFYFYCWRRFHIIACDIKTRTIEWSWPLFALNSARFSIRAVVEVRGSLGWLADQISALWCKF